MVTLEDILSRDIPFLQVSVGEFLIALTITVVLAIILFLILLRVVRSSLERSRVPPLLTDLLVRLMRMILAVAVVLTFLSLVGFDISSLILATAAIFGLILGFGMSNTMNNFFAGVFIAVNRPIEKGEYVTINGMTGIVEDVEMMFTKLVTLDNELIIIPNGQVWGQPIINKVRKGIRRVDVNVHVPYDSDLSSAVKASMDMMASNSRVLADPGPSVFMSDLDESAVKMQLRPWCDADQYWSLAGEMRLGVLEALKGVGIKVPFPQIDVHMPDATAEPPVLS